MSKDPSIATRLGLVSFFNDCSSEAIARALPVYLTATLGATPEFVGLIEGAAEAVAILLRAFSGWASDRMVSRKPLVFAGYALSVAARAALLLAHIPAVFGAARLLDRTGKGLRTAPRDALVADATAMGKTGRAFGITRFLDTLGAVTGLLVALALGVGREATMSEETFRTLVYASIPFGLMALLFLAFFVPRLERRTPAKKYLAWEIPKEVRGYLLVVGLFALANSSDAFLVIRATQLGLTFRETLVILVFFNMLAAALAVPAGRMSDKFGRTGFLAAGWVVYAVAYAVMGFATTPAPFIAAFLGYGIFYGFTEGVEKALLADLLPPAKRGTGYGAMQLVLGLAALPASLITGGLMTRYGAGTAFGVSAAVALVAAALLVISRRGVARG